MNFHLISKAILLGLLIIGVFGDGGPVAPVGQPVAYANSIPYNVPPHGSRVDIVVNRGNTGGVLPAYAQSPVLHASPLAPGALLGPAGFPHHHGLLPTGLGPAAAPPLPYAPLPAATPLPITSPFRPVAPAPFSLGHFATGPFAAGLAGYGVPGFPAYPAPYNPFGYPAPLGFPGNIGYGGQLLGK